MAVTVLTCHHVASFFSLIPLLSFTSNSSFHLQGCIPTLPHTHFNVNFLLLSFVLSAFQEALLSVPFFFFSRIIFTPSSMPFFTCGTSFLLLYSQHLGFFPNPSHLDYSINYNTFMMTETIVLQIYILFIFNYI